MDELFELSDDKLEEARKEDEAKILDLEGNDLVSESDDGEPPLDIKLFLPKHGHCFLHSYLSLFATHTSLFTHIAC